MTSRPERAGDPLDCWGSDDPLRGQMPDRAAGFVIFPDGVHLCLSLIFPHYPCFSGAGIFILGHCI